jgi:hypothetical protein
MVWYSGFSSFAERLKMARSIKVRKIPRPRKPKAGRVGRFRPMSNRRLSNAP